MEFFNFFLLFLLSMILKANGNDDSPNVIIVGAGVSGIAAASKLFQNGFKNVKILEAENRIGGRIHTTKFGDYLVDLGAQWVHGEEGNVAYEMAWPLGVLEKGRIWTMNIHENLFDSSGNLIDQSEVDDFNTFNTKVEEKLPEYAVNNKHSSIGKYYKEELDKFIEEHPKWKDNKKGLTNLYDMMTVSVFSADTWDDVSTIAINEYEHSYGEFLNNWKERGYSTILDILMKRFPKPEEELPVMSNTILNVEVSEVDYSDPNGKIKVKTTNGDTYSADHVIVTCSLGVLKDKHKSMFKPALPEDKQKAIEGMGFGNVGKIILSFDKPWWPTESMNSEYSFLWKDKDLEMLEKDDEKKWLQGLISFLTIEHKPKLLEGWVSGKYSRNVEKLTDEQVKNHVVEVLQRFVGKNYNVTNPTGMIRTMWHSNKHFKGAIGFRSSKSDPDIVTPAKLSEPVGEGKPMILFAGEATNPRHFSAVHGAIETGWREADRLIEQHPNVKKN